MSSLIELRGNKTQTEVAKILGISKSYLSLLERGKRKLSLDIANKMSGLYGVSIDEIFYAYKVCILSTEGAKEDSNLKTTSKTKVTDCELY